MFAYLSAIVFSLVVCERLVVDDLPFLQDEDCSSCERVYVPVCASNNVTYTNECRYNCVKDAWEPKLTILHYGPCLTLT
ncbi:hypothetical protein evm_008800 [Chilo suppressalis]|nr:hypothetical protein evm_008800 [Chilo suppressalis]